MLIWYRYDCHCGHSFAITIDAQYNATWKLCHNCHNPVYQYYEVDEPTVEPQQVYIDNTQDSKP